MKGAPKLTENTGHHETVERLSQPVYGASMGQAVARFFKKYARFKGFASRSEYWWVALFHFIVTTVVSLPYYLNVFGSEVHEVLVLTGSIAMLLWAVTTLIPMLAIAWRRLHDAGLPGPLYFLMLIPVIGPIVVLIMLILPTRQERHKHIWTDPANDKKEHTDMAKNTGRWYFGAVLGKKSARITILIVALAFLGIFWLLTQADLIEAGPVVAVVGIVLFVIVAFPLAMLVGRTTEKKINPED